MVSIKCVTEVRRTIIGGAIQTLLSMELQSILIACGIGIVAGWLASLVMKGGSSGLLRNLLIGLLGGIVGSWLLPRVGLRVGGELVGAIITAFIGAVVLLLVVRLIAK